MIKFSIITLFPEALEPYLSSSMMWKAREKGILDYEFVNLREFGLGPHRSVDDTPYGGGDGMLLRCEPVFNAVESVLSRDPDAKVVIPTPVGEIWSQEKARYFADLACLAGVNGDQAPLTGVGDEQALLTGVGDEQSAEVSSEKPALHMVIICPHYEGYDERILSICDYKFSMGNYILTGGELPALIMIDSIVRLLPGVLGGENSAAIESFSDGDNLEYPQYTKPAEFRGMKVPEVLMSGNHQRIAEWRLEASQKMQQAKGHQGD